MKMKMQSIEIKDADIKSLKVRWYDENEVFIEEIEAETGIKHTLLLTRECIPDLLSVLKAFMETP